MWPIRRSFRAGLRWEARRHTVRRSSADNEQADVSTFKSISADWRGFYETDRFSLGRLTALIILQAELDGVSRVCLHYTNNKMIYTIAGVDYEMVPMPSPMNVDAVRELARLSDLTWSQPGFLRVRFADGELNLEVSHEGTIDDLFLELRGFSSDGRGPSCHESPRVDASHQSV